MLFRGVQREGNSLFGEVGLFDKFSLRTYPGSDDKRAFDCVFDLKIFNASVTSEIFCGPKKLIGRKETFSSHV